MLKSPSAPATASSSASSISSSASSSVILSTSSAQGGGDKTGSITGIGTGSSATASSGTASASASQTPFPPAAIVASSAATTSRNSNKQKDGHVTGPVSASHVLRTTSTASAVAASSSSGGGSLAGGSSASDIRVDAHKSISSGPPSPQSINSVHSGASSIMIAPPPRVALGAGSQSTATVPEPASSASGGSDGSPSNAASGPIIGPGSSCGTTSSSVASGSKEAQAHHFVYTANHYNHHQRHHGHRMGHPNHHHSIASVPSAPSSSMAAAAAASLNASAASAQLVREKDLRIAQLERELKIMESEFTRELDRLSKAESETATFWQAKHSRLQQQTSHSDVALQLLRAEIELREAERTELRAGWEKMQRAAVDREEETRALRNQVRGLKEWVSTSTRTDGEVASDEVFGDGMARLANGLQNWVIVHFRRAKLDLEKAGKAARDELAKLVPMYEDLAHSSKLQMLQSAVSRIFVNSVFESYYAGLSAEQASQLVSVESFLRKFAGATEPINQWRSLTLAIVSKDADQQLRERTTRLTDSVVARVNSLLDAITAEGTAQRSDARDQALRQLVTSAVELARLLMAQKAVLRVFMPHVMPHQHLFFDAATMEDIGGEEDDEEGLSQREIACVTFPGVIKRGDETGSQLQYTNVICKAKVLCAAE